MGGEEVSERGSFVTEYIYCARCLASVEAVLCGERQKYLCAQRLLSWEKPWDDTTHKSLPIIAGKVGGLYGGEELHVFEFSLIPALSKLVCHRVAVAVLSDSGHHAIFVADPSQRKHSSVAPVAEYKGIAC